MSKEDRAEIFFLKANDLLFKPNLNPVGTSIVSTLFKMDHSEAKFIDVPLDGKQGYFIIASPSTWPPFAAKMRELLALLEKVKLSFKVIMIYIHEAHADDVWPVGYGINSAKNLDEKW